MRVKLRRAKMAGAGEARDGLQVAEYEKLVLEVGAEMLYLNTVGLRKLGVWLGIRSVRLESKGRVTVLGDVRSYLHRSSDAEETIEGKVGFLRGTRDHIRQLMEEPDNWEQTPSRDRAMVISPFSTRPRDSSASTQPPLLVREAATRPRPLPRTHPRPRPPPRDDSMSTPVRPVRSLPSLPRAIPEEPVNVRPGDLPTFSVNSVPPWNRGGGVDLDELSLEESLRHRVEEDRRIQAERHTISIGSGSEADTFSQLQSQYGEDERQATYTVNNSEEEDNLRIQTLQNEIAELKLKRKRADLSSKSSSSGSSTHRVPQPKLSKRSMRSSLQRVPQSSKVSDLAGSVRRKVGVSGPDHSSSQSSDDSLSGDDKLRHRNAKLGDGVLVDGKRKSSKTMKKKKADRAERSSEEEKGRSTRSRRSKSTVVSSDEDKCKIKKHSRSAVVSSEDEKRKMKRHSRTKLAPSSDEDKHKSKRHSRRKLDVPSEEKKSKLKRHATKKSTVDSSSDDGKLKSKRQVLKEIAETSSDDHKTKRPSRKRSSSTSSLDLSSSSSDAKQKRHSRKRASSATSSTSSSDEKIKHKKSLRKSSKKSKKGGGKGCTVGDLKDAWRREFKIKGQIGKIGDKENKLDYLSVKQKISAGREKGHKDAELIEGVINCTTPGTTLRSFLQSSESLTLPIVLDILRSYFQEADSVELLQRLATAVQGPREDAQTFLMACLDLKNRIVRNEDDDIGFSRETVMKILLKTLETGLSDDRILNSMRPFLSDPAVSDNVLISEMSHAVMLEKKRKEKSKSSPRVASVEAEESSSDAAEIAKLQKQLDKLREERSTESAHSPQLAQLQASLNKLVHGNHRQYGCKECKKAGKGKTCSHCFVCGEGDHKVVDCPRKKENKESKDDKDEKDKPLNSNRSPTGDI